MHVIRVALRFVLTIFFLLSISQSLYSFHFNIFKLHHTLSFPSEPLLRNKELINANNKRKSFSIIFSTDNSNNKDNKANEKSSNKKSSSTKFSRMIDDFIGKRYGSGEAFYGKRTSDLSEEEYSSRQYLASPKAKFENKALRDNAILLVGDVATSRGIAEWISFDLYEKGFAIRLACIDKNECIKLYGLPGNNVDMIELSPSSAEEDYALAVQGVQAVVFCGSFEPEISVSIPFMPFFMSVEGMKCETQFQVARKVLDIAFQAQRAKVGTVKKVVAVSRATSPSSTVGTASGLNAWLDLDVVSHPWYERFRFMHGGFEGEVRRSGAYGLDYVIVRAPDRVLTTRLSAYYDLDLVQEGASPSSTVGTDGDSTVSRARQIGVLDLAECIVQALLSDTPAATFTVAEEPSATPEPEADDDEDMLTASTSNGTGSRVARNAYYSILDMGDEDMISSYMLRPAQVYKDQLEEDLQLEVYWRMKFADLISD